MHYSTPWRLTSLFVPFQRSVPLRVSAGVDGHTHSCTRNYMWAGRIVLACRVSFIRHLDVSGQERRSLFCVKAASPLGGFNVVGDAYRTSV